MGSNTAQSKDVTTTGGTTDRTLEYAYSTTESGNVKITVNCTTNSIYIKSIAITTSGSGSSTTLTDPEFKYSATECQYDWTKNTTADLPTLTYNNEYDGEISYKSSSTSVATVGNDGTVTPVANGTTTITATYTATETYKGGSVSYTLTIANKPIEIEDGVFDFNLGADYGSGLEPKDNAGYGSGQAYEEDATTWTAGNVTMIVSGRYRWWKATKGNTLRTFSESTDAAVGTLTISAPVGKVITAIDFDGSSAMTPNTGSLKSGKWTGTANTVEFENNGSVQISKITVTYGDAPAMEVTVGTTGFATLTPAYALDFSNTTIKAYTATVSGEQITLTKKDQVAAGEGVLIYAEGGKTEEIPAAASAKKDASNAFVGTLKDIESLATEVTDGKNYILSIVNDKVGFYQAAGKKVGAGKAYLHVAGASEAKQVYEIDLNAIVTGINSAVNNKTADGKMYNLNGQRVGAGYKGVVIVNGKKVIKSL